ncbi:MULTISPECIES: ferritin-like domain-containing protein [Gulbenkiania]|uniref:DUF2383 domain-containing protein n=2 Tax=Gulbenkiania TaxID=397456 RepID=A0A0K6GUL8_9NEIS|nr:MULTISPECIES: PA2169 family four-helix-bundle protein [Gulbenkiania]TCW33837.1 uncharacterized protein (TIGR02284 family) [Gulbenkiania mobilis]CUA82207.1 conserved hypothetical protein [Gulbenkiania indica]
MDMMTNEQVVETLNDLIETSKDGEYGFESCAEYVDSQELRNLFTARAQECRQAAEELKTLVVQYGGTPDKGGTASGALHRGWVSVRGTLSGNDDKAMLDECERGEDTALSRYRDAMDKALPEPVKTVIARQLMGVQRNHDQIKALRNRFNAAS